MTTPRNRRPPQAHPVLKRAAPRPGWENQNAKKHHSDLVLYRALIQLFSLLARGPVLRPQALEFLRIRGIGFHTAQAAAALIGVPPVLASNKPGFWQFPAVVPHLPTLLERIEQRGRHVGKEARHQRGLFIQGEGWVKSKSERER